VQQRDCASDVTRSEAMSECLVAIAVRFEPASCSPVQPIEQLRDGSTRFDHEEISKQMVVPEPFACAVEANDELVAVRDVSEPAGTVGRSGDSID